MSFVAQPANVPELVEGEPEEVALENALRKARAAWGRIGAAAPAPIVLGCDTLVSLDGAIYGKPASVAEARRTLAALSGARHEVYSGLALLSEAPAPAPAGRGARQAQERVALARTAVTFRELDEPLLEWYLSREEWRGRAGGYAIQGAGAALVREIEGDYENVVGLPVATLLDLCPELLRASSGPARA